MLAGGMAAEEHGHQATQVEIGNRSEAGGRQVLLGLQRPLSLKQSRPFRGDLGADALRVAVRAAGAEALAGGEERGRAGAERREKPRLGGLGTNGRLHPPTRVSCTLLKSTLVKTKFDDPL